MKKWIKILVGMALMLVILAAGCKGLTRYIHNYKACDRFTIDHVEVRTGIDIPAVKTVNCLYHDSIKRVTFTLDTQQFDVNDYLANNQFVQQGHIFSQTGQSERTTWEAEFDRNTSILKIALVYKD